MDDVLEFETDMHQEHYGIPARTLESVKIIQSILSSTAMYNTIKIHHFIPNDDISVWLLKKKVRAQNYRHRSMLQQEDDSICMLYPECLFSMMKYINLHRSGNPVHRSIHLIQSMLREKVVTVWPISRLVG